ncbi:hypothetical protein [Plastoroseomonas arctica]|uniref:Polysaccharide chain length determinant N-terminal domain-containing protein n=1 Tax=Plastoroseomonas arctica TaxID=1509237 RepID=A0AAF1K027_9PROT|nr:hypothetical protein [Plastoroseomonas arctica]MBR0656378.1 hypothetical protein [Plastoroseomonas arctica]
MSEEAEAWLTAAHLGPRPDEQRPPAGGMALETLLRALWQRRARLALAWFVLLLAGATPVLVWTRSYVAEITVAPAETTGIATSTLLAPLAIAPGNILDTRPSGNFAIYLAALRSTEAAMLLAERTPLLAHLTEMRAAGLTGAIRAALGLARDADLDDAKTWLEANLSVTPNPITVTWEINLPHPDRTLALDALQLLHGFAEAKVRADIASVAARRIAILTLRLDAERDLFLRNGLVELLAQQQRAAMVVAAEEAVAARLVSMPYVELRPSLPNRPLLIGLLAVAGAAVVGLGAACLLLLGVWGRAG